MRQIRFGVFETNSSSTHSLTMCSGEEFNKWKNGEFLYWGEQNKFATREDIIEELKNNNEYPWYKDTNWNKENEVDDVLYEEGVKTYEEFFYESQYETFEENHTTPSGETIFAFGYYGYDY